MTRRWLVVCCGLLLVTSMASFTWGDEATRPPSLAERVAALSRSWKQKQSAPSSNVVQASHTEATRGPQEPGAFPQIDPRSLIPTNLFSRGGQKPITGAAARMSQAEQRHLSDNAVSQHVPASPALRSATAPRAGSAYSGPVDRNGFTLPGLGGSRPVAAAQGGPAAPAASSPSNREQQLVEEYKNLKQQYQAATSSRRAPVEVTDQASSKPSPSLGRPSPGAKGPTDYSDDEFRHELSGIDSPGSEGWQRLEAATEITDQPSVTAERPTPDTTELAKSPASSQFEPSPMTAAEPRQTAAAPSHAIRSSESAQRGWALEESSGREHLGASVGTPSSVPATRSVATRSVRSINRNSSSIGREFSSQDKGPDLLVENQTPLITSDIRGPKQILVGREATYELRLQNQGDFDADEVEATVHVPSGAEVVNSTATRGVVHQSQDDGSADSLRWHLQHLAAGATETLEVKLIPHNGRPLELGMTWTTAPMGSRAVVEVQEPKLNINVTGPEEVLYGKPQLYRLTLSNPGTGVAENVKIELMPPGGGQGAVTSHRLGSLPAGASKTLQVELTAREAGKLQVKAAATADGGLTSNFAKDIFCRKPELEVDWRGPEMTYSGTEATYFFRVRNPGTAPANDVAMTVNLPDGVELVSASEGQSFDRARGQVSWQVGSLQPGDDFYSEIRCVVNTPGANELNVAASTAAGDLADSKRAQTQVVALADLKLDVTDPTGPVPVGEEAVYEIHVLNRGANTAQDVNVVGLFSDGVEPIAAEGAPYDLADGRVAFHTIDSLPAGRQVVLRIRAKAVQAGTHVFRAEVLCRDLEIKLASEETTRFFDGTSIAERNTSNRVR
jgi:uncharacterized repeat protein (TIGR01451 family)